MLLAIDSTAVTASVALTDGENIINSEFSNTGLTHSETLLPMIERVMQGTAYSDLDGIAITAGPGSFTGVRIGVATAKGLAFQYDTPCYSVSTLDTIAHNFLDEDAIVCAVMDARRMQFYNALFQCKGGVVTRLTPDRAISIEDLRQELEQYDDIIIAGDGARLCYDNIGLDSCRIASDDRLYQNALAIHHIVRDMTPISARELMPVYLRQSQAERELKLKKELKL